MYPYAQPVCTTCLFEQVGDAVSGALFGESPCDSPRSSSQEGLFGRETGDDDGADVGGLFGTETRGSGADVRGLYGTDTGGGGASGVGEHTAMVLVVGGNAVVEGVAAGGSGGEGRGDKESAIDASGEDAAKAQQAALDIGGEMGGKEVVNFVFEEPGSSSQRMADAVGNWRRDGISPSTASAHAGAPLDETNGEHTYFPMHVEHTAMLPLFLVYLTFSSIPSSYQTL